MTYPFLLVVSVAITLKLMFLSFSLYYTVKTSEAQEKKTAGASGDQNKKKAKSLLISWKQIPRLFLPRSLYCPDVNNKNYINK